MKIDTKSILLPDGLPPKGKDHPVAENCYPDGPLPGSLNHIREDPVASGSREEREERDAMQNEARYAVRQSIPRELMIRGLVRAAKIRRPHSGFFDHQDGPPSDT
ncbi:hypothetical protein Acid7E03_39880 [Acidisoma sp. 7E03]